MATSTHVIVGGGLAASRAADGIRDSDSEARIVIVSEEERLPYERPPLSKAVLVGDKPEDSALTHPAEWYAEHDVELRLGTAATALDVAGRTLTLADGSALAWDRLLLATGSTVRRLDVPGGDLLDVLYLRSMPDSAALRSRLVAGSNVVLIGAGWIGLEVAAAARTRGCEVTIVEPQAAPLLGVVGEQVGRWFADLHAAHGVALRLGDSVERLEGDGVVRSVVTGTGEVLPADTVVVGIGIVPNTRLAAEAGLEIDNGVVCDERLRTSADGVFAAGDVASWFNPTYGERMRVEHWANALNGGFAAGQSMAGEEVSYGPVPYFFSDQYDVGLEYAGHVPRGTATDVVLRGSPETNEFQAFWLDDGDRVLAGMHVNMWDSIDDLKELARSRTAVDRARLGDAGVPLGEVGR
ncbi:MAG TPA: FAD-dependent oxidoreductase [Intrasporangium sp.]|uniref:NAD(P)/FAD-dependent oxidoreductase n=1 Tax=Intrasporangium sp. TaxID=1925024 RepID=UPI002D785B7E|nr:FAD-dependent oxidoreductase [Intrasporangium sp.]HET7399841.1 FAD-dependent oxidoreductase [Intrasporangium sp.]